MRFHGINLLHHNIKLGGHNMLVVSDGAGFLVFKWPLRGKRFGVLLKHFALFGRVPGSMQYACIFCTGRRIARVAYIISLEFASAALLGVGWQGVSSYLLFPAKTSTVGFCLLNIF